MSGREENTELAAAVAEQGALPVPVGPELSEHERLRAAFVAALDKAHRTHPCPVLGDRTWSGCVHYDEAGRVVGVGSCHSGRRADAVLAVRDTEMDALRTRVAELEAQRERRRVRLVALQNDALNMRGALSPMGEARKVPMPLGETLLPAVEWLIGRVAELEAERHTTNEALDDAVQGLRERDGRIAELEALTPAAIQTCRKCGAGYTYGQRCTTCEFRARMAAEIEGASGPSPVVSADRLTAFFAPTQALRDPKACEACGDLPERWCPDCAACKAGCFGGFDGNACSHANAPWGGGR